jgi:hypothetical protein
MQGTSTTAHGNSSSASKKQLLRKNSFDSDEYKDLLEDSDEELDDSGS